jgi:hypothetical protein
MILPPLNIRLLATTAFLYAEEDKYPIDGIAFGYRLIYF